MNAPIKSVSYKCSVIFRIEIVNLQKNKNDLEGMLHVLQRHISSKNDKDQSSHTMVCSENTLNSTLVMLW